MPQTLKLILKGLSNRNAMRINSAHGVISVLKVARSLQLLKEWVCVYILQERTCQFYIS